MTDALLMMLLSTTKSSFLLNFILLSRSVLMNDLLYIFRFVLILDSLLLSSFPSFQDVVLA
jgi:hypothetical protein